jgi:putative transcriptional regulator
MFVNTHQLREKLGLTQRQFAARYGITLGTLKRWEGKRSLPSGAAVTLLRLIEAHPQTIANLVADLRTKTTETE